MTVDIGRAADCHMIAQSGRTRDACGTGHNAVFAQAAVMCNLNKVIDLRALADHRVIKSSTVNSGIGADLHVVFNTNAADLRNLHPFTFKRRKTETVAADDAPRLQNAARADCAVMIHGDIGMKMRVFSDY